MSRDDRRRSPLDDTLEAALKWQEHAGPRELALGKQAHELALIERAAGLTKGLQDQLGSAGGGDRDRLHRPQEPAIKGPLEVRIPHDKPDQTVRAGDDEEAIG